MYDFINICRLCLAYNAEFYDLSSDDIMEKLVSCISDLEFEDHFPTVICDKCLEQVDLFYQFRNKCLRSEFIINRYMDLLLGNVNGSHFRSKLQVQLTKNSYSSSKSTASNIKLKQSTSLTSRKSSSSEKNTSGDYTDITDCVKLRKRCQVKRIIDSSSEEETQDSAFVKSVKTKNLIPKIRHISDKEKSQILQNKSEKTLQQRKNKNFQRDSKLPMSQSTSVNRSNDLSTTTENQSFTVPTNLFEQFQSSYSEVSMKNNSADVFSEKTTSKENLEPNETYYNLGNSLCNIAAAHNVSSNSNEELYCEDILMNMDNTFDKIEVKSVQGSTQVLETSLDQDNIFMDDEHIETNDENISDYINCIDSESENEQCNSTQQNFKISESDNNINNVESIEINDENISDDVNRMMLLESIIKKKRPYFSKSANLTTENFKMTTPSLSNGTLQKNCNSHSVFIEHSYSGKVLIPEPKKLLITVDLSEEAEVDIENYGNDAVEESDNIYYIDENKVKNLMEKNRRSIVRNNFEKLFYCLPCSENRTVMESKSNILKESKIYIEILENEARKKENEKLFLLERNWVLKDRLQELSK